MEDFIVKYPKYKYILDILKIVTMTEATKWPKLGDFCSKHDIKIDEESDFDSFSEFAFVALRHMFENYTKEFNHTKAGGWSTLNRHILALYHHEKWNIDDDGSCQHSLADDDGNGFCQHSLADDENYQNFYNFHILFQNLRKRRTVSCAFFRDVLKDHVLM